MSHRASVATNLKGNAFEGTVLVSSVRGFTKRCEELGPAEAVIWTNGFLHQVTEATLHEGGIPVKYLGDALLAFFAGDDHEERAISAALSARDVATDPVDVALASGPLYLAAIGHQQYARPDVIGSTVNLAFRVLGWAAANATTGVVAALSPKWQRSPHHEVVVHSNLTLKGLPAPLDLVEISRLRP